MRTTSIALLLLITAAQGADRPYMTARLANVVITDMSTTLNIPPLGQNTSGFILPIQLGTKYEFTLEADGITYSAACISKAKKSFAAEWVVNDPVQYRIEKYKLFLKRPSGKPLRLALIAKVRNVKSDAADASNVSESPLRATARQNIPECR